MQGNLSNDPILNKVLAGIDDCNSSWFRGLRLLAERTNLQGTGEDRDSIRTATEADQEEREDQ